MPISESGNMRIAIGIQATAGIGRNSSNGVANTSSTRCDDPISKPNTIPRIDPARKPPITRAILD